MAADRPDLPKPTTRTFLPFNSIRTPAPGRAIVKFQLLQIPIAPISIVALKDALVALL
jgi:hypothetical protein